LAGKLGKIDKKDLLEGPASSGWLPSMPVGLSTQEVTDMLPLRQHPRKRADRSPFRSPPWGDDHPSFRRIDPTLPDDHHARWLAHAVAQLDLTAFRQSYKGYGSLAYPVELLLAFVLFLYSKGVLSPAEWARRARYDDQCKWLLRGLQPSRSQLYTFRDRVEPFLDDWHRQLLRWAIAEGLTRAARASVDGTFVAALASRHQLMGCRRVDRRLLLLRLLVGLDDGGDGDLTEQLQNLPELACGLTLCWLQLLRAGLPAEPLLQPLSDVAVLLEMLNAHRETSWRPRLPAWVPRSVAGRRRVLGRYEDAQQRLQRRLEPYRRKKQLSKKDKQAVKCLKVSLTDPQAALGWDKAGTYRPLYNLPLVQATDAPLTLAWDVLPRVHDEGLLRPMLEKAAAQLGRAPSEVVVDGSFASIGELLWCEQQQITVYAPAAKAADEGASAAPATPAEAGGAARAAAKLGKEAFRYEASEEVYICPQGKRLEAAYRTTAKRQNGVELVVVVHRAKVEDCQACPRRSECTRSTSRGRTVKRYEGEEALERLRQRRGEPVAGRVYQQRCRSVELARISHRRTCAKAPGLA
jgi:transposase